MVNARLYVQVFQKMEKASVMGVPAQSHLVAITYLFLATVDLPFLLGRKGKHGLSMFFCEIQLILWEKEMRGFKIMHSLSFQIQRTPTPKKV